LRLDINSGLTQGLQLTGQKIISRSAPLTFDHRLQRYFSVGFCQDLLNSISLFLSNRILRVHFSEFCIQPLDFGSQMRDKLRHLIFVARYGEAGGKVI
jgi:hypothetical protein